MELSEELVRCETADDGGQRRVVIVADQLEELLSESASRIATEYGYVDQSHLHREVVAFTAMPPTTTLADAVEVQADNGPWVHEYDYLCSTIRASPLSPDGALTRLLLKSFE